MVEGFITRKARDELRRLLNQLIDHKLRDLPTQAYKEWRDVLVEMRDQLSKLTLLKAVEEDQ